MELTVSELAALVGGQFASPAHADARISGVASVAEAGVGDVTFLGNARYLSALKRSMATAALVPLGFSEVIPSVAVQVENPSLAFAVLVERFSPPPIAWAPGVHPTAVVGEDVELGEDVSIQPFAVLEAGVRVGARTVVGSHCYLGHGTVVGAGCHFHPHVTIRERCLIGNRVIIHSGAVLGSDGFGFVMHEGRHVKVPQLGVVQIDDDVEIGANVAIDRARFGRTWIQHGTKIDNLVQIAHNVVVGPHCILVAQVAIAGSVRLGEYVVIAGQAGIAGHLEIGDHTVIGAQSGVAKTMSGGGTYQGSPIVPVQEWREQVAAMHRLPKLLERVRKLERLADKAESLPTPT